MSPLFLGLAVLLFFVALGRGWLGGDPKKLARQLRYGGGTLALIAGTGLSAVGREIIGIPLAMIGLGLLGRDMLGGLPGGIFGGGGNKAPPSRMRSAMIEIGLAASSDIVAGRVVAGSFAGRDLASFSDGELARLLAEVAARDPRGSGLLEAYLDRRRPGWREHLDGDAGRRQRQAPGEAAMTEQQAYQILGLEPGAGAAEIHRAHRALMMKLHPDRGGSTYLAVQVNAAKDLLLRGHR
ncbi:MAG TPA: DnaJ domain-containing protein [Hyphomicrobiales bacterium]|nr:DnaJ domain-containing protein [Hyphomicrobiales bacterium]